jgi:hypothetical protein
MALPAMLVLRRYQSGLVLANPLPAESDSCIECLPKQAAAQVQVVRDAAATSNSALPEQ